MKVIVNYDRAIIVCKYDMETLAKVCHRKPDAMILFSNDDAHDQIAKIDIARSYCEDGVSSCGITFNHDSTYTEKTAVVSVEIPNCVAKENVNKWIRDEFGMVIVNCNKIEEQIGRALEEMTEEDRLMDSMIEIHDGQIQNNETEQAGDRVTQF